MRRVRRANPSDVVAGLRLLVAPFALGYAELFGPLWNDVVAHFHYVLSQGSMFGIFAGFYYWIGEKCPDNPWG